MAELNTATGRISRKMERSFSGRTFYSFFLQGVDGLFRNGTKPVQFDEGTDVVVLYKTTPKGFEVSSVEADTGASSAPAKAESGYKKPALASDRDSRISWMSARNSAIEVAKLALEQDAYSLGTKKADKLDNLTSLVQLLTVRFYTELDKINEVTKELADSPEEDGVEGGEEDEVWDD